MQTDGPHPPRRWQFSIPILPVNINRRERAHWTGRHTESKRVEQYVWAMSKAARIPKAGGDRRAVHMEFVKPLTNRRPDDAPNLQSRSKPVLDALVRLGYLVDDSPAWLEWHTPTETRSADGPRTVVTITEVPAA